MRATSSSCSRHTTVSRAAAAEARCAPRPPPAPGSLDTVSALARTRLVTSGRSCARHSVSRLATPSLAGMLVLVLVLLTDRDVVLDAVLSQLSTSAPLLTVVTTLAAAIDCVTSANLSSPLPPCPVSTEAGSQSTDLLPCFPAPAPAPRPAMMM